ncbi:hypothetical protein [Streptomyces sp. NPDC048172]|uniref:hypothetical protein n=1 Tax=Streptomyces sp. NPDC048172 TaxID=3365505 RepID=UPI00371B1361
MRTHARIVAAAATVLTAGALAVGSAGTAQAAPSSAHEPRAAQAAPGRYLVDGGRIRSQPNTGATTVGYGYRNQDVTVHCRSVVNGEEWLFHTNDSTGVTGWSRWDVIVPWWAVGDC